jgi:leader peptidase (prepilin peptidase)/N-methyltransferase
VELLTALLFVAIWRTFSPWEAVAYTIFVSGLIVASFIDFEHYIIPNEITWGGVFVGIVCSGIVPALQGEVLHSRAAMWSLAGAVVGYGILWGVVELGKIFLGVKKVVLDQPTEVFLTPDGIRFGDEKDTWEEIFSRETDILAFDATGVRLGDKTWEKARIQVNWQKIKVGEDVFELEKLGELMAVTQVIYVPREAMGFGDVKFLAAIGAFLGAKAIFFIILVSSLLGSVVGLTTMAIGKREWGLKIPYGPYLALAAIFWIFWGPQLFARYVQWVSP